MGPINAWEFGTRGNDEPGDHAALAYALAEAGAVGRVLCTPGRSRYSLGVSHTMITRLVPSGVRAMFSTHPATEDRIEALQEMAAEMGGEGGLGSAPTAAELSRQMYSDRPARRSALDPIDRG